MKYGHQNDTVTDTKIDTKTDTKVSFTEYLQDKIAEKNGNNKSRATALCFNRKIRLIIILRNPEYFVKKNPTL